MNPDLQLRDIHLPPDISLWPPALGWWLLMVLLVALLLLLLRRWQKRKPVRRRVITRPALRELERIETDYQGDPAGLIKAVSVLLRRSAMSLDGRRKVSGLTGNDWLVYLDQHSAQPVFRERFQKILTETPYRERTEASVAELMQVVRDWLLQQEKRHV